MSTVTTEWTVRGYFGRIDCASCGFAMIGKNRTLHVRSGSREIAICDGCVNAIATMADGELHYATGERVPASPPSQEPQNSAAPKTNIDERAGLK